jgi:F-type H+-transporting ATPase subunit delta
MTISRTALARFLISQPASQRPHHIKQAAAWLVSTGQARRTPELVNEVARLQAEQGHLWASVTTARPLSAESTKQIEKFLKRTTGASTLEIETKVNPDLIGGALIETASQQLDSTIATKLRQFIQEAAV